MKPIINPWFFYWISTTDSIKFLAGLSALFLGVVGVLLFIFFIEIESEEDYVFSKKIKKVLKISIVLFSICLFLNIFLPSEDTLYKMMVSSCITEENIEKVGGSIEKVIDYTVDSIAEIKGASIEDKEGKKDD